MSWKPYWHIPICNWSSNVQHLACVTEHCRTSKIERDVAGLGGVHSDLDDFPTHSLQHKCNNIGYCKITSCPPGSCYLHEVESRYASATSCIQTVLRCPPYVAWLIMVSRDPIFQVVMIKWRIGIPFRSYLLNIGQLSHRSLNAPSFQLSSSRSGKRSKIKKKKTLSSFYTLHRGDGSFICFVDNTKLAADQVYN